MKFLRKGEHFPIQPCRSHPRGGTSDLCGGATYSTDYFVTHYNGKRVERGSERESEFIVQHRTNISMAGLLIDFEVVALIGDGALGGGFGASYLF